MKDAIEAIFDNLDAWRHLPAYQLERRADIFFAAYLPEILHARFGTMPSHVIPEFPVHIPTIRPGASGDSSFRIDYLAISTSPAPFIFVELKTDNSSHRPDQDLYLKEAAEAGLPTLIGGISDIYKATKAKRKYDALLKQLDRAGLITFHGKGMFEIKASNVKPTVVYIQPAPDTERDVIHFVEIAQLLEINPDPLRTRFARSLREWATVEPGDDFPAA